MPASLAPALPTLNARPPPYPLTPATISRLYLPYAMILCPCPTPLVLLFCLK